MPDQMAGVSSIICLLSPVGATGGFGPGAGRGRNDGADSSARGMEDANRLHLMWVCVSC